MSPDDYIETMQTHKENLLHIYDNFSLPEEDKDFFQELRTKNLSVIVLTEDWCGDAMLNIPILLHIAQAAEMKMSILLRDSNLELMDQYLTNGKSRSIPIFIFFDEEGQEIAKWGPRAPKLQEFVNDSFSKLPNKEADDFDEIKKEMLTFITKAYRGNTDFWEEVYHSIKLSLANTSY